MLKRYDIIDGQPQLSEFGHWVEYAKIKPTLEAQEEARVKFVRETATEFMRLDKIKNHTEALEAAQGIWEVAEMCGEEESDED